jgi:hypothetical protein
MESVNISIKDFAELIRCKTFLELYLATYDKERTWANENVLDAIKELMKESEGENA